MIISHTPEILIEMLDLSIGALIENDICAYCSIFHKRDERCESGNFCSDLIFQNFEKSASDNLKE